jgi:hypothetical protein
MLVSQILALWFLMHACRIALPLFAAGVVFLIVRVGTMIPNAPANVGSFQFFTFLALRSLGVEKTVAAGFSIVLLCRFDTSPMDSRPAFAHWFWSEPVEDSDDPSASEQQGTGKSNAAQTVDVTQIVSPKLWLSLPPVL